MLGEVLKQAKEDPKVMQAMLHHGKEASDFDPAKLTVGVIPCGFRELDKLRFIKQAGELIIIGARPSVGKSALGFQIGFNLSLRGRVLLFSLEMEHAQVAVRQLAALLNLPIDYLQGGAITPEQIQEGKDMLKEYSCVIDDRTGLNIHHITEATKMQHKLSPLTAIVVDYIQIVDTEAEDYSRAVAVGRISAGLKELARELRIPVIALSQLNRNSSIGEKGKGPRKPQLADLKESGNLEQDADVVALIHRPDDTPNTATIIIAKNRNGPVGEVILSYAPAQCQFIDNSGGPLD